MVLLGCYSMVIVSIWALDSASIQWLKGPNPHVTTHTITAREPPTQLMLLGTDPSLFLSSVPATTAFSRLFNPSPPFTSKLINSTSPTSSSREAKKRGKLFLYITTSDLLSRSQLTSLSLPQTPVPSRTHRTSTPPIRYLPQPTDEPA